MGRRAQAASGESSDMKPVKRQIRVDGDVAYVPLTKGYEAVIDASMVDVVSGFNWSAQEDRNKDGTVRSVYALRLFQGKKIRLHRQLVCAPSGYDVDHIDGDGLNNRMSNIRVCTHAENSYNQGIRPNNKVGIKGVWARPSGSFQSKIRHNGKVLHLGTFASAEQAGAAYADASVRLHGEYGRIN